MESYPVSETPGEATQAESIPRESKMSEDTLDVTAPEHLNSTSTHKTVDDALLFAGATHTSAENVPYTTDDSSSAVGAVPKKNMNTEGVDVIVHNTTDDAGDAESCKAVSAGEATESVPTTTDDGNNSPDAASTKGAGHIEKAERFPGTTSESIAGVSSNSASSPRVGSQECTNALPESPSGCSPRADAWSDASTDSWAECIEGTGSPDDRSVKRKSTSDEHHEHNSHYERGTSWPRTQIIGNLVECMVHVLYDGPGALHLELDGVKKPYAMVRIGVNHVASLAISHEVYFRLYLERTPGDRRQREDYKNPKGRSVWPPKNREWRMFHHFVGFARFGQNAKGRLAESSKGEQRGAGEPRHNAVEHYFNSFLVASTTENSFHCSAEAAQSLLYQWDQCARRPQLPLTTQFISLLPFQMLFVLFAKYCKNEPRPRDIPAEVVLRALPTTITHKFVLLRARESVQALCHDAGLNAVLLALSLPWIDSSTLIGGQRGVSALDFTPQIATFLMREKSSHNAETRDALMAVFIRTVATLSDLAAIFTHMAQVLVDAGCGDNHALAAFVQQLGECQALPGALQRVQAAVLGLAEMHRAYKQLLALPLVWHELLPVDTFHQLLLTAAEKSAAAQEPAAEDVATATKMGGVILLRFMGTLRDEALFISLLSSHAAQFCVIDLCTLFDVHGKNHHPRDGMKQLASFLCCVPNNPRLHSMLVDHVAPKVKRMKCSRMLDNALDTCCANNGAVQSVLRTCWLENAQWDEACMEQALKVARDLEWNALVEFVLNQLAEYGLVEALANPLVLLTASDLNVSHHLLDTLKHDIAQYPVVYLKKPFLIARDVLAHPDERIRNICGGVTSEEWPLEQMRQTLARAEKYLKRANQCLTFVRGVGHTQTQEIVQSLSNEKSLFCEVLGGCNSPCEVVPDMPYDVLGASAFFLTYIRHRLTIQQENDSDSDSSSSSFESESQSLLQQNVSLQERGFLPQLQTHIKAFSRNLCGDLNIARTCLSSTNVAVSCSSFQQFFVIRVPVDPTTMNIELERAMNIASLTLDEYAAICEVLSKAARFKSVKHAMTAMTEFVEDFASAYTGIDDFRSTLHTLVPENAANDLCAQATVVANADALNIPPKVIDLACELADAREFIQLVQEYLDQDLRLLADNEYNALPVPVVNALLDAQRFLRALKNLPWAEQPCITAFDAVSALLTKTENACIFDQLRVGQRSQHGLQVCLKNIHAGSNAIVKKIDRFVADGLLRVVAESDSAPVAVRAEIDDGSVVAQWSELQDWQRRAYLVENDHACIEFLRIMTLVSDLCTYVTDLRRRGHFDYRRVALSFRGPNFSNLLQRAAYDARDSVKQWTEKFAESQRQWYPLSFFSAEQLWVLYDSLSSVDPPSASGRHLLRYLGQCDDTCVNRCIMFLSKEPPSRDPLAWLGARLLEYAAHTRDNLIDGTPRYRELQADSVPCAAVNALRRSAHPHLICVAPDDNCLCVLLALYYERGRLPNMEEVLFCRGATTETVIAFVNRALCAPFEHDDFFCLVNVEVLPYADQVRVGEKLDRAAVSTESSHTTFALCLITEEQNADARSAYLRHKYNHVRVPYKAMSAKDANTVLQLDARNPCTVVVSDRAAHGKTYHIQALARRNRKSVFSLHLSGPVDFERFLVQRLQTLCGNADNIALHVDIGAINTYTLLSDILFTLVACGGALAGSSIAMVNNVPLYIEIGNVSAMGNLIQRVPCLSLLHSSATRVRFSVDELHISTLPRASVQVVCGVLLAVSSLRTAPSCRDRPLTLGQDSISAAQCRAILKELVAPHWSQAPSYTEVTMHLSVLARELVYFSRSVYFQTPALRASRVSPSIRGETVRCLLQATAQFTRRSLASSPFVGDGHDVGHVDGMAKWNDAKAMVVFNRIDLSTLTAIFRHTRDLPPNFQRLFTSQGCALPQYDAMSSDELVCALQRLATRASHETAAPDNYKLTVDNFLKMVWIILKTEAKIPVVLCGETGCGKTSLIRCVACIQDIACECLNVHAGTTRKCIVNFLDKCVSLAAHTQEVVYCFLDEVNTNEDALALVSEMLGGQLHGESLPPTLKLLCAVNPYRPFASSERLMYHVLPLPDKMLEYVYDFGALGEEEELKYIRAMVNGALKDTALKKRGSLAVDLIAMAQRFVRQNGKEAVLSLRDVQRCCDLILWFAENLETRDRFPAIPQSRNECKRRKGTKSKKKREGAEPATPPDDIVLRAILNALLICYYCRLSERGKRENFRTEVQSILCNYKIRNYKNEIWRDDGSHFDDGINQLFCEEMKAYVKRMVDVDSDIALNEALLENTFVTLVCILTRIPVFIIGHPGCSKSLSLTLIGTHLRGASSVDPFFRKMPEILYVSYQGSEISTSEGLIDTFARAERIQDQRPTTSRVVVHLDECGLAERSPHNPFKVLHAKLESAARCVSVVGLSNDALDAAKMNRAVCIQRPLPNENDLRKTAKALDPRSVIPINYATSIASAYLSYWKTQEIRYAHAGGVKLHGMRDFYALVKSLCSNEDHGEVGPEDVYQAAYRHFGGCPMSDGHRTCNFLEETGNKLEPILGKRQKHDRRPKNVPTVQDLVRQNLEDAHGRHLMLIYSGAADLAFHVVQNAAERLARKVKVHMGSKFADDRSSDHYALLMLKRIRHSIEHGHVLILHQLDATHGSLYDVLNQNYSTLCGKKIGRLALGAVDERVMVHDHFRCIILLEDTALPTTDSAFLNRFEKHRVCSSDVLTRDDIDLRDMIIDWVRAVCAVPCAPGFGKADTFAGWREEVASYVALECKEMEVAQRCLRHLATADGVQRAAKSEWGVKERLEFEQWRDAGVAWSAFMEQELAREPRYTVVFTFEKAAPQNVASSITTMRFDYFSSERDLERELKHFLSLTPQGANRMTDSGVAMLGSASQTLLMCGDANSENVAFVTHRVKEIVGKGTRVILLLHATRAFLQSDYTGALHFRSGWMPYLIEDFDSPATQDSFDDSLECAFKKLLPEIVPMALWRIKYPCTREAVEYVLRLCDYIPNDPLLVAELLYHCRIHSKACVDSADWQFVVATSRTIVDNTQGGWSAQVLAFWRDVVREPVAKFLYKVEKENALNTLLELDGEKFPELRTRWFRRCREVVPDLRDVPTPTGPECYTDYTPTVRPLRLPFVQDDMRKVDAALEKKKGDVSLQVDLELECEQIRAAYIEDVIVRQIVPGVPEMTQRSTLERIAVHYGVLQAPLKLHELIFRNRALVTGILKLSVFDDVSPMQDFSKDNMPPGNLLKHVYATRVRDIEKYLIGSPIDAQWFQRAHAFFEHSTPHENSDATCTIPPSTNDHLRALYDAAAHVHKGPPSPEAASTRAWPAGKNVLSLVRFLLNAMNADAVETHAENHHHSSVIKRLCVAEHVNMRLTDAACVLLGYALASNLLCNDESLPKLVADVINRSVASFDAYHLLRVCATAPNPYQPQLSSFMEHLLRHLSVRATVLLSDVIEKHFVPSLPEPTSTVANAIERLRTSTQHDRPSADHILAIAQIRAQLSRPDAVAMLDIAERSHARDHSRLFYLKHRANVDKTVDAVKKERTGWLSQLPWMADARPVWAISGSAWNWLGFLPEGSILQNRLDDFIAHSTPIVEFTSFSESSPQWKYAYTTVAIHLACGLLVSSPAQTSAAQRQTCTAALNTLRYTCCCDSNLIRQLANPHNRNSRLGGAHTVAALHACAAIHAARRPFATPLQTFLNGVQPWGADQEKMFLVGVKDEGTSATAHELTRYERNPAVVSGTKGMFKKNSAYVRHEPLTDSTATVRDLHPLAFRLLHFLTHAAMLDANVHADSVMRHLSTDWSVLTKLCANVDPTPLLINCMAFLLNDNAHIDSDNMWSTTMSDAATRDAWERRFAEVVPTWHRGTISAEALRWGTGDASELDWLVHEMLPLGVAQETCSLAAAHADLRRHFGLLPDTEKRFMSGVDDLRQYRAMLLLGEGNFSFAVSVRKLLSPYLCAPTHMVATSLDSLNTLITKYADPPHHIEDSLTYLRSHAHVTVMHKIDATALGTASLRLEKGSFDCVIFNFPHAGVRANGSEYAQDHVALLHGLFSTVANVLDVDRGVVRITMLSHQYAHWRVVSAATQSGFALVDVVPFDHTVYPEYRSVWGDIRDYHREPPTQSFQFSYHAHPATFIFSRARNKTTSDHTLRDTARSDLAFHFRARPARISFDALRTNFYQQPYARVASFPLVDAVLRNTTKLVLVSTTLPALLGWVKAVNTHFTSQNVVMEIHEFAAEQHLDALAGEFVTAWNLVGAHMREHKWVLPDHAKKEQLPDISMKSVMSLCCVNSQKGSEGNWLYRIIQMLVSMQNEFVAECRRVRGSVIAKQSTAVVPPLQDRMVEFSHWGICGAWEQAVTNGQGLLCVGRQACFDYLRMESWLARDILPMCAVLPTVDTLRFPFHTFRDVKQGALRLCDSPSSELDNFLHALPTAPCSELPLNPEHCLDLLDELIPVMTRMDGTCDTRERPAAALTLQQLTKRYWKHAEERVAAQGVEKVRVEQVRALYGNCEVACGKRVEVREEYKRKLFHHIREALEEGMGCDGARWEAFANVLYRLMWRMTRLRKRLTPESKLADLVDRLFYGEHCRSVVDGCLPRTLLLAHIHSAVKHVEHKMTTKK